MSDSFWKLSHWKSKVRQGTSLPPGLNPTTPPYSSPNPSFILRLSVIAICYGILVPQIYEIKQSVEFTEINTADSQSSTPGLFGSGQGHGNEVTFNQNKMADRLVLICGRKAVLFHLMLACSPDQRNCRGTIMPTAVTWWGLKCWGRLKKTTQAEGMIQSAPKVKTARFTSFSGWVQYQQCL